MEGALYSKISGKETQKLPFLCTWTARFTSLGTSLWRPMCCYPLTRDNPGCNTCALLACSRQLINTGLGTLINAVHGVGVIGQQLKTEPEMLESFMGISLSPSCLTSKPSPYNGRRPSVWVPATYDPGGSPRWNPNSWLQPGWKIFKKKKKNLCTAALL